MFHGYSICILDAKSRLTLPLKFRKQFKPEANEKLVLTRGMYPSIFVYPQDEWEKALLALNRFKDDERYFMSELMLYANVCVLDSRNRMTIPRHLREFAKLKKEVIVIGLLNHLEIWDPGVKVNYDATQNESYKTLLKEVPKLFRKNNRYKNN